MMDYLFAGIWSDILLNSLVTLLTDWRYVWQLDFRVLVLLKAKINTSINLFNELISV